MDALKTEGEYSEALAKIERLMNAAPGSWEEVRLEALCQLVEAYEEEHYPIDPPDPAEAIKFRKDQEQPPE